MEGASLGNSGISVVSFQVWFMCQSSGDFSALHLPQVPSELPYFFQWQSISQEAICSIACEIFLPLYLNSLPLCYISSLKHAKPCPNLRAVPAYPVPSFLAGRRHQVEGDPVMMITEVDQIFRRWRTAWSREWPEWLASYPTWPMAL